MENVIDYTSGTIPEKRADKPESVPITEVIIDGEAVSVTDEEPALSAEYSHVRSPELRRGAAKILMSFSAILGTAAGIIAVLTGIFGESAEKLLAERFSGGFRAVFGTRLAINAFSLMAEYLLGFFALGDILVWIIPLFLGLGTGLTLSAAWSGALLPSALGTLVCGIIGAALSSEFSEELRGFANGTCRQSDNSPAKRLTLRFLALLAGMALAALYEGIIAQYAL